MYSLVIRLGEKLLISLFLKRPSSLELGRSVLIMGARVIQLIGAILDPAEGSLVGNRFSRGHAGGGLRLADSMRRWSICRLLEPGAGWRAGGKDTGSSAKIWRSHRQQGSYAFLIVSGN